MTYLSSIMQDWFEVTFQQEDHGYTQPWLFTWYLFVDELWVYFGLLDSVGDTASLINNLQMKPRDKIATYNVDFIWYVVQLNWSNNILYYQYYQGLSNHLQNLISN